MPIARTTSKWQIQLPLVAPSPFWGGAARRAAGGMIMPPNGVQGQRPWHAFGDFRRETKVTRGAGRSARISWAAGAHAPAPALPGERSTPFTYTPKRTKSCIPTCNRTERKIKNRRPSPSRWGEPLCMLRLTTHQHVPSNATCDPGKIIVPQLLKIAGKSVIITKLDCIH